MVMPKRYQRKRDKGAKLPPNVISCTRPGKFGNPYRSAHDFRCAMNAIGTDGFLHPRLEHGREAIKRILADIEQLRGKDLACWCAIGKDCHVDVLLQWANK